MNYNPLGEQWWLPLHLRKWEGFNEWDKYCYTDNIYCSEDNDTFKAEKSNDRYILTTDKEQITFELIKEFTERF